VTTDHPASVMRELLRVQARWYRYFNQSEYWKPNGRPPVAIVDMEPEWRFNCRRFLECSAINYARNYIDGCEAELVFALEILGGEMAQDSIEREMDEQISSAKADPVAWVKTTPLYRALGQRLPTRARPLRALATRASHYDGCPRRAERKGECHCHRLKIEVEERDALLRRETELREQMTRAQALAEAT